MELKKAKRAKELLDFLDEAKEKENAVTASSFLKFNTGEEDKISFNYTLDIDIFNAGRQAVLEEISKQKERAREELKAL